MKIKTAAKIFQEILICVFTAPMQDHTITWDEEGNVKSIHGHTWTWSELYNHWFGPRIQK